jgi:hypothetical protein
MASQRPFFENVSQLSFRVRTSGDVRVIFTEHGDEPRLFDDISPTQTKQNFDSKHKPNRIFSQRDLDHIWDRIQALFREEESKKQKEDTDNRKVDSRKRQYNSKRRDFRKDDPAMKHGGSVFYDDLENEYDNYGIGGFISDLATAVFGNATTRMKNFLKEHGLEQVESIEMGRQPIESAISLAMQVISKGEFLRTQEKKGYDAFFHLFLIINGKYRLEKNQTVNVVTDYQQKENEERISLGSTSGTIDDFIAKAVDKMGESNFWQNYDPLKQNCQWWAENTVKANGLNATKAHDFAFQDTQDLVDAIEPSVQDKLKDTTDLAAGLDKLTSWLSNGKWGLKRGGKIGYMK